MIYGVYCSHCRKAWFFRSPFAAGLHGGRHEYDTGHAPEWGRWKI